MPEEMKLVQALLKFIQESPTAFHATENFSKMLEENGFERLEETEKWDLVPGGKYYLTRNLSSILAFRFPVQKPERILISASHSDSPMFKLKENFEAVAFDKYLKLDTEVYGGTIFSTWLDRPLSIGGRVIVKKDGVLTAKIVKIDRDLAMIPSVAIHLNRDVNGGYAFNPAVDLTPLAGEANEKGALLSEIAQALNCRPEEIAGTDLFLYNNMKGTIWGLGNEFFSAPRIDNLMCAYGTMKGFLEADGKPDAINLWFCADNEEVGSATKQGALSSFLRDVIDRIAAALGMNSMQLLATGFMVSADNGHAQHPNHPELSDPLNSPHMGGGIVVKSNASQHYATDGFSAAVFEEICKQAKVPFQPFANRSDQRGGSTLGSLSDTQAPMKTIDIGLAQLAMHSAYETAGTKDLDYLIDGMKAFYSAAIDTKDDQTVSVRF